VFYFAASYQIDVHRRPSQFAQAAKIGDLVDPVGIGRTVRIGTRRTPVVRPEQRETIVVPVLGTGALLPKYQRRRSESSPLKWTAYTGSTTPAQVAPNGAARCRPRRSRAP
jgi:hypothetical protein